jgi:catechol 2,3-dioxygenase-like lactoylglutathione lyase family enzyme
MQPQPLIAVRDVEASSRWYQRLLGCQSAHGGKEYERLVVKGVLIMQLHRFEVEHHHVGLRRLRLREGQEVGGGQRSQADARRAQGVLETPIRRADQGDGPGQ